MIYESIRSVSEYLAFFFYQESSIRRDLVDHFVVTLANSLIDYVHRDVRFCHFVDPEVKIHRMCECKGAPEMRLEINTMNSETRLTALVDDAASVMQLTTFEVASFLPLNTNIYFSAKYAFFVTGKNAPVFIYKAEDCPLTGELRRLKQRRLLKLDIDLNENKPVFKFDETPRRKSTKKKKKVPSPTPVASTSTSPMKFVRPASRVSSGISYAAASRQSTPPSPVPLRVTPQKQASPPPVSAPSKSKPRPPPLTIAKATEDSPPPLASRLISSYPYTSSNQRLLYSQAYVGGHSSRRSTPRSAPPIALDSPPKAVSDDMGKVEFGRLFRQMVQARIA